MKRWKFRIGIVLVFALGGLIGSLGTGWWFYHGFHDFRGPRARVESHIMSRLSRYLDLDEKQKAGLTAIVHDVSSRLEEVRAKAEPEVTKALEDGMARAKPLLSAEQYTKLEQRYREMRRRWEHRHDD